MQTKCFKACSSQLFPWNNETRKSQMDFLYLFLACGVLMRAWWFWTTIIHLCSSIRIQNLCQRANYAFAHLLGEGSLDFRNAAEPRHTPTKKQKSLEGTYRNGWLSRLKTSMATYIVRRFPTILVDSLHVLSQGATSRLGISSIDCVLEFMCHVGDVGSWVEKFGKSRSPNLCGLWQ